MDFLIIFYEYSNTIILKVNKGIKNKTVKYFLLLLLSPYIFIKGIICLLYDYSFGRIFMRSKIKKDNECEFRYDLGFVAIVKNEGDYIREWIEYHRLICRENNITFYIYDNESEDNLKDILSDYIWRGIVRYIYYPGQNRQREAYEDAAQNYGSVCRYMAFIDMDEFIEVMTENLNAISVINNIFKSNQNAVGIGINWVIYGSSGQVEKTEGIVIERFLNRAQDDFWGNNHIKTIANPRFIKKFISCHYPLYKLGSYSVSTDGKRQRAWYVRPPQICKIRLNHYFGKSCEEYINKRSRGWADQPGCYVGFERFNEYNRNEVHDESMLKYVDEVKWNMNAH